MFALRVCGFIVEEGISEEELFSLIENFYEPGFDDFEVEFWNGKCWEKI